MKWVVGACVSDDLLQKKCEDKKRQRKWMLEFGDRIKLITFHRGLGLLPR